ncbi:hypothetical protein AMTR_s00024p00102840 [Amborella trichopoda]|uniref:Uncharacterized protein n=1 Tax=Amborella trichopoda TaxID=13333 RepID=W1PLZ2_AMBTC|nr:hypothetical protein AMTR_s00024p00102840 [Amborella trichopoda]
MAGNSFAEAGSPASKKRKRPENKVFRFKTFMSPGIPANFVGDFRRNIEVLLSFGRKETGERGGSHVWLFGLEPYDRAPARVSLIVVEEEVERSLNPHCDHCKFVGSPAQIGPRLALCQVLPGPVKAGTTFEGHEPDSRYSVRVQ